MIKKEFLKVNEEVYYDKIDNGLGVYLYPTKKTKNFYITISVKYGARVLKYKLDNKIYDIIPGSAHFLEHKVMALSENKEISKRINDLGSLANAWTSYYGTNYNIFGSINIRENLKLLLDIFYHIDINDKCVEEEKGIIGEEIDMYKDKISSYMYQKLFYNMFNESYAKNSVVGERSDIEKITSKELNRIYNHFYIPSNTFIIVCGDFNKEDILNDIKEYMKNISFKNKTIPSLINKKDKEDVFINYEEIKKDYKDTRIKYAFKIDRKKFNIKSDDLLRYYLDIIFSINLSTTSPLYEKYRNDEIIYNLNYSINIIDGYVIISIDALVNDSNKFMNNISKDILNLTLNKEEFDIKKKLLIKSYLLDFDSIEDIEYNICNSILKDNKVNYNEYKDINNMDYNIALDILNTLYFDKSCIIKTIK